MGVSAALWVADICKYTFARLQYQGEPCVHFQLESLPLANLVYRQGLVNPDVDYVMLQKYTLSGSYETSIRRAYYWKPRPTMEVKVHSN